MEPPGTSLHSFLFYGWDILSFFCVFVLVSFFHVHIFLKWLVVIGSPFTPTMEAGKTCFGIPACCRTGHRKGFTVKFLEVWLFCVKSLHVSVSGSFLLAGLCSWRRAAGGVPVCCPSPGGQCWQGGQAGWRFWPLVCVAILNFLVSSLHLTLLCMVSDISFCFWYFQKIKPLVCSWGFLGKPQFSFSGTFSLLAHSTHYFWSLRSCGSFPYQAGFCDSPQVSCNLT